MRLRLDAEPEEFLAKGGQLLEALAQALEAYHPDLADALYKAAIVPADTPALKYPVLETLRQKFKTAYERQMQEMVLDIGRVLDQASREVRKSATWDETLHPRDNGGRFGAGAAAPSWTDEVSEFSYGTDITTEQKTLNPTEMAALSTYVSPQFEAINAALRRGETSAVTGHLDAAISKSRLDSPSFVRRGVMRFPQVATGDTFTDAGYVSTTKSFEKAMDFASREVNQPGCLMHIKVPAGHPALDVDGNVIKPEDEGEILLGRNTTFRVTHVEVDDGSDPEMARPGMRHIFLEVVP